MARDLAATNDIARKGEITEITPLQTTEANGSYGGFLSHGDHPKSSKSWISVLTWNNHGDLGIPESPKT